MNTLMITVNGKQIAVIGSTCSQKEAKANGYNPMPKTKPCVVACIFGIAYGADFNDAFNTMTQNFMKAI